VVLGALKPTELDFHRSLLRHITAFEDRFPRAKIVWFVSVVVVGDFFLLKYASLLFRQSGLNSSSTAVI
jgi:hypothetical protein